MESPSKSRLQAIWDSRVGGIGLLVGLIPHLLHHLGFLVGTALIAGSGGTALFGALGLLSSLPMLIRLRRRFNTLKAPAIALVFFALMFALSNYFIGPMLGHPSH